MGWKEDKTEERERKQSNCCPSVCMCIGMCVWPSPLLIPNHEAMNGIIFGATGVNM